VCASRSRCPRIGRQGGAHSSFRTINLTEWGGNLPILVFALPERMSGPGAKARLLPISRRRSPSPASTAAQPELACLHRKPRSLLAVPSVAQG